MTPKKIFHWLGTIFCLVLVTTCQFSCSNNLEPIVKPCEGVDCSDHGKCVLDNDDQPVCECDPGFSPDGLSCVPMCDSDSACPQGSYCHESGVCREGCRTDPDDCQTGRCDPGERVCITSVACCGVGTTCQDVPEEDCVGLSQGEGSSCATADCPAVSACCSDGACSLGTAESCTGFFEATVAIGCDPNPCCQNDEDCAADSYCDQVCRSGCRIDPDNCVNGLCDPDTRACIPSEACCEPGGGCTDQVLGECAHYPMGQNTSCAADACPLVSACCFDGACTLDTEAGCTGFFEDTLAIGCDPNPCCTADTDCGEDQYCDQVCRPGCRVDPDNCTGGTCDEGTRACKYEEACCWPDGTCADGVEGECTGTPLGAGTTCATDACPAFEGSCLADADCEVGTCDPASGQCVYNARYQFLVEDLRQAMVARGVRGMAVAIVENGEVTFATGLGVKEPGGDEWVRASTLFRIGWLTSTHTAVAMLQLADGGSLDLDASVTTYLPGLAFDVDPDAAPSITSRHLLTHASAMDDYMEFNVPTMLDDDALREFIDGDFGSLMCLMAPSGRMYNSAYPNFYLAGRIVEAIGGAYYRDIMRNQVWLPLGMQRTFLLPAEVLADGDYVITTSTRAPYQGLLLPPDAYDNGWGRPSMYAFSSVLDQAEFIKFLRNGNTQVLSDDLRVAMQSPQIDTEQTLDLHHFGFGLHVWEGALIGDDYYDIWQVWSEGNLPGYSTDFTWIPELDIGYVTLASGDSSNVTDVMYEAMRVLTNFPDPVSEPDLSVDPDTFGIYEGDFYDPYVAGCITVTKVGTALRVSIPRFDSSNVPYGPTLQATTPHNFQLSWWGSWQSLTFLFDGDDQVEYMRLRGFVAKKVDSCDRAAKEMPLPELDIGKLKERASLQPKPRSGR